MTWTPPGFTLRPVRNRYVDSTPTIGLVLHVAQGNGSLFGWFDNPSSQASSTWWAGKKGQREQYGDPDTQRFWAQAAGNRTYHSIETEGYTTEPLTPAQLETVAQALAAGHTRYGWPLQLASKPGDPGLGWHGMGAAAWGNHPGCPGDKRRAQMPAIITRAKALASPPKEKPMATSGNGWPTFTHDPGPTFLAPTGQAVDVASHDLAVLFAYVMWRIDTEIRTLQAVYGGRTLAQQQAANPHIDPNSSNHRSYTACDQWDNRAHTYEPNQRGRYTSGYTTSEEKKIRAICAATDVLQWGDGFPAPYRDPVHVQVKQARNHGPRGPRVVSAAQVKTAAGKIGTWVKAVQKAVGVTADGLAGPGTIAAVKKWQRKHGLTADGIWGAKSMAAAGGGKTPPAKKPPNKQPANPAGAVIVEGDRGSEVTSLQEFLNARSGVKPKITVDGVFGAATKRAVMTWQGNNHLSVDGRFGAKSKAKRAAQEKAARKPKKTNAGTLRKGDRGATVGDLQHILKTVYRAYAGHLKEDKVFGPATDKAVREFQRRAGLTVDGIVGPKTAARLHLKL